jgi:hypothetical protein
MASPQFHHLLEQIHKTSQTRKLAWQPVAKSRYSKKVAFRLALGEGVVRIEAEAEDDEHFSACYAATLSRRDGLLVDEARGAQFSSEDFTLLRDIYLDRMVDEMQADLEAGRVRELPPEEDVLDDGIPF